MLFLVGLGFLCILGLLSRSSHSSIGSIVDAGPGLGNIVFYIYPGLSSKW
jgi:hypothetical protein